MKKLIINLVCALLTFVFVFFGIQHNLKTNPEGKSQEINGISNNYIRSVIEESGVVSYKFKEFNDQYLTKVGNMQTISNSEFEGTVTPLKQEDGTLYFEIDVNRNISSFAWFCFIVFIFGLMNFIGLSYLPKLFEDIFKKEKSQT